MCTQNPDVLGSWPGESCSWGLVTGTVAESYLRPLVFLSFVFMCVHISHVSGMFSYLSRIRNVFILLTVAFLRLSRYLGKCVELWS